MFTFLPILYRLVKLLKINKRTGTLIRDLRVDFTKPRLVARQFFSVIFNDRVL